MGDALARSSYLFTSESVSEGHPDKVADQISDAILDAFLANDLKLGIADKSVVNTRLGCETLVTTDKVVIAGEGRGQAPLFKLFDSHQFAGHREARINRELIQSIARGVIKDIGYDQVGFSFHGADIEVLLHGQSPDIAMGVDEKQGEEGARAGLPATAPSNRTATCTCWVETWARPMSPGSRTITGWAPGRGRPRCRPGDFTDCAPGPTGGSPMRWAAIT
jgi:hypothetical protein